jgi:PBP1b-binding outer membrane lipoprotein LpoB
MRRVLYLLFYIPAFILLSCNEPRPEENQENATEQSITKPDSMPSDHTGVAPDSNKNTPGMNIGK